MGLPAGRNGGLVLAGLANFYHQIVRNPLSLRVSARNAGELKGRGLRWSCRLGLGGSSWRFRSASRTGHCRRNTCSSSHGRDRISDAAAVVSVLGDNIDEPAVPDRISALRRKRARSNAAGVN